MAAKEKTPTNGAKKSSKKNQRATQIVAVRDRLTLGLCRYWPSENAALLIVVALAGCIGVVLEVLK